jgi:hypothetical protein
MANDVQANAHLGEAGFRTFLRIADRWRLTEKERIGILGLDTVAQLAVLEMGETDALAESTLERLSYALGIYKAINTLLPVPERADSWIRAANTAPTFAGRPPIDRMITGSISDLRAVRQYLDAQLI